MMASLRSPRISELQEERAVLLRQRRAVAFRVHHAGTVVGVAEEQRRLWIDFVGEQKLSK